MYKIPPKLGSSSLCWARGSCQKNLVPTTQPSGSYTTQPSGSYTTQPSGSYTVHTVPIETKNLNQDNGVLLEEKCSSKFNLFLIFRVSLIRWSKKNTYLHTWANLHYIFIPTKYLHYMNVYKNKFKNEYMTYIGNLYYIFVHTN